MHADPRADTAFRYSESTPESRRVLVDAGEPLTDSSSNVATQFHEGDGLHRNNAGNQIWIAAIPGEIDRLRATAPRTLRSESLTKAVSVATQ
jgi:hypothetical protein